MASKRGKIAKSKKKLSPEVQSEVRYLKLAIENSERAAASATGDLKTYFERLAEKNRAKLAQLTGEA